MLEVAETPVCDDFGVTQQQSGFPQNLHRDFLLIQLREESSNIGHSLSPTQRPVSHIAPSEPSSKRAGRGAGRLSRTEAEAQNGPPSSAIEHQQFLELRVLDSGCKQKAEPNSISIMELSLQEGRPSPSSPAVQNAAPTEAAGPIQQLERRASTTASSEYRKHSLEDILHTPDGISTKRVKSSLAVVAVPECNVELQGHGDGSSKPSQDRPDYQEHHPSLKLQSKGKLMARRKRGEVGGSITGSGIVDGSDVSATQTHGKEIYGSTNVNIEKPSNLNVESPARVGAFNISGARVESKIQEEGNSVSTFWEDYSRMSEMLKITHMRRLEMFRGLEKSSSTAEGSVPSTQGMSPGGTRQRDTNRVMNSPNTTSQESRTLGNSPSEISSVKDNPRIAYPSQVSATGINSDMSIFCGAPSLLNLLKVIKQNVPNWLAQFPQSLQQAKALEALLPSDEETIRKKEDDIRYKELKIKALEQKYDELLQMMPESQHEELLLIKEKSKRTMQQEVDELMKANEDTLNVLQVRKAQIAQFKFNMANLKQVLPEVMQALTQLVELAERLA